MKKFLTTTTSILMASAFAVSAETVTFAAGGVGGGYDKHMQKQATIISQHGYDTVVTNNAGSEEIALKLCNEEAQVGVAQIDAIERSLRQSCDLKPIGVYGEEFAVIMFPPKSKLDELEDLDETKSVLVDSVGSGSSLFFRNIVDIETGDYGNKSDWSKVNIVEDDVEEANTLAEFNEIDAVVMVRKFGSKDISNLLALGWKIGYLYDKDINDYLFKGDSLYEFTKIKTKINGVKVRGQGYIVKSFTVASPDTQRNRELFKVLRNASR